MGLPLACFPFASHVVAVVSIWRIVTTSFVVTAIV